MEKWLLVVANEKSNFVAAQRCWLKKDLYLTIVPTIHSAVDRLAEREYMAVAVFMDGFVCASQLSTLWTIRPDIPITLIASKHEKTSFEISSQLDAVMLTVRPENSPRPPAETREEYHIPNMSLEPLAHRDLSLYPQSRKVFFRGREVRLSRHQFEALNALLANKGRLITFVQLYDYIFGEFVETTSAYASARYFISEIRRKMNEVGGFDYIENVRGIGYRMNVEQAID